MKRFLPANPRLGEGCIRRDDLINTGSECPSIDKLVREIEYVVDEFSHRIRDHQEKFRSRSRHEVVEGEGRIKIEEAVLDEQEWVEDQLGKMLKHWTCLSSQGLRRIPENVRCGKYHLVFAPGLRKQGRNPDTLKPKMKELTRIWAVCQPEVTVIVCSEGEMKAQLEKDYYKWVETYKCWGGEIHWIQFEIRSLGFQVVAGKSSRIT